MESCHAALFLFHNTFLIIFKNLVFLHFPHKTWSFFCSVHLNNDFLISKPSLDSWTGKNVYNFNIHLCLGVKGVVTICSSFVWYAFYLQWVWKCVICFPLDCHQTIIPASSPWPICWQIQDSPLNTTSSQSPTLHDCFSSAHWNLVLFCLGVNDANVCLFCTWIHFPSDDFLQIAQKHWLLFLLVYNFSEFL